MKKKAYLEPAMQVVELRQQTQLLAGSGTGSGVDVTLGEEDWIITPSRGLEDFPNELQLP